AFETMTNRFMEQNAWPTWTQGHVHGAGRSIPRAQIQYHLAHRFPRVPFIIFSVNKKTNLHPPAAAETADLAIALFLRDASNVQPREGLDIAYNQTLRRGNQNHLVFTAQRNKNIFHSRVQGTSVFIDVIEQSNFPLQGYIRDRCLYR